MAYDRLLVEVDEDRWAACRRLDASPGDYSRAAFELPKGFSSDDLLQAAKATGWVIEQDGRLWIDRQTGCAVLAGFVGEMFCYFDAPNTPSKRLVRVRKAIDQCLAGAVGEERPSAWACAWLDLIIRDDAKEDVLTADDIWRNDFLQIRLTEHRERRLREVLARSGEPAKESELRDEEQAGRMAPSQRLHQRPGQSRREVG